MKYNLDNLHWQEFETLSFNILQILVAPGVQYLKGGNDKGRDIVYTGTSNFNPSYDGEWIFQVKHKSKGSIEKNMAPVLSSDLKEELTKVFITNDFSYNVYVFVTNVEITATIYDSLFLTFNEFKTKNKILCNHFDIIGFQSISSCIDSHEKLKWSYPNIISHPDFQILIQQTLNLHLENRRKGWIIGFQRQKDWFVHTRFFEIALEKLNKYPAIILSGPPKSGKTFNAEMLAMNLSIYKGFQPILVETIEDMEYAFQQSVKQVFIFDDAFGKYTLSYDSKEWFSRLEHIFSLADQNHLFIFTSREYIFREFINYGNEGVRDLLTKIIVESHDYSKEEKLSLLGRYTILSNLSEFDKAAILAQEDTLTNHKNFSPETIRSFFSNLNLDTNKKQVDNLISHLDQPDKYLADVFYKLSPIKQAVLLSILCSVSNKTNVLVKTFSNICKDLQLNALVNAFTEFDELDDSILKIARGENIESIRYYHPSMQEFLIREMIQNESSKMKEVIVMNLNNDLLSLSFLISFGVSIVHNLSNRNVPISKSDFPSLSTGMKRLISNTDTSLHQITEAVNWFTIPQHTLDLKLNDKFLFSNSSSLLSELINHIFSEDFFSIHRNESPKSWSILLNSLNNSIKVNAPEGIMINEESLTSLLSAKKSEDDYWTITFRSLHFISDDQLINIVGRDWLNVFFSTLKKDIDILALEVYGDDYPDFKKFREDRKKGVTERVKEKPNRTWYPRFLSVEDRIEVLREVKGTSVGGKIFERLIDRYNHIHRLKDFAKNRHNFIVGQGWWAKNTDQD